MNHAPFQKRGAQAEHNSRGTVLAQGAQQSQLQGFGKPVSQPCAVPVPPLQTPALQASLTCWRAGLCPVPSEKSLTVIAENLISFWSESQQELSSPPNYFCALRYWQLLSLNFASAANVNNIQFSPSSLREAIINIYSKTCYSGASLPNSPLRSFA